MKALHITVRRWMDSYGNTYFSSCAYIDGNPVVQIPYEYGYGQHGEYVTWRAVQEHVFGNCPEVNEPGSRGAYPSMFCRENDIIYTSETIDVPRKKDL